RARRVRRPGHSMTSGTATGAERRLTPVWSRTWVKIAGGFIVPLIVLAAWQYVTTTGIVPPYRLPPPWSVVRAGIEMQQRGELIPEIAISVQRVVLGFVFGSLVALVFAAVVGLSRAGG